jgi:hypothetical protein
MLTVTASYSKEAWEFESLPRSAREADKSTHLYPPKRPLPLSGRFPFYHPPHHSPHMFFLV